MIQEEDFGLKPIIKREMENQNIVLKFGWDKTLCKLMGNGKHIDNGQEWVKCQAFELKSSHMWME